ncbi:MAG: S8 family serine peptidase [Bacteroidetes bacterium]|nr:S8 family serine peptidase [Bacteroidota bacterium]
MAILLQVAPGLLAQDGSAPVSDLQRFSPKRLTFSNAAGRSQYRLSTKYILIQFGEDVPMDQQRAILEMDAAFATFSETAFLPAPRVVQGELRKGISEQEVVELLNRLVAMPEVRYANPFLEFSDGTLMGIQDRFHVKLRSLADLSVLKEMAREQGAAIVENYSFDPMVYVLSADKNAAGNAFELARLFEESRRFAYAEPDFLRLLAPMNTNDPYLSYQWSLNNTGSAIQYNGTSGADMEVFNAWGISTGSSAVKVAIIDEGTDLTHPDLVGNMLPGFDATGLGSGGGPQNNDAHGTACAGIVAAVGNNNLGVAGIAYNSKIVPVRIAYKNSSGNWVTTDAWIATAIDWAWNQGGADVLSNSWGGGGTSALINGAIDNAITLGRGGRGASVIFAAGNSNNALIYPANYNQTIAVAAMSMCDTRKSPSSCDGETWWGSCYGTGLDVGAPGVKIYTTDISGAAGYNATDYTPTFNGTSSACPNTAGVMALIYSVNPLLTHAQARVILETTTEKVGGYTYNANVAGQPNGTWSTDLGYGRVNAYNAVLAAQAATCVTDTVHPTIAAPANIVLPNALGQCARPASLVSLGTPTAADNCPNTLMVTNNAPAVYPLGMTTVIWTVTDGANNVASAAQTVTIVDVTPPTITAPVNIVQASSPGQCSISATLVTLGVPVVTDDCPTNLTISNDAPAVYPMGTTTVTWTAIDGSNNSAKTKQLVTIIDTTTPTITAPLGFSVPSTPGMCSVSAALINLGTPVASDNCLGNLKISNNAPAVFPLGATTVIWTVIDGANKQASAAQIITVIDNQPPTITAPPNLVLPTAPGLCSVNAGSISLGNPIVVDNCPTNLSFYNNAPPVFPRGTTVVTWTAVDGANHMATATQTVTVEDRQPPTITACAPALSVEGDAQNNAALPDLRSQISAYDNCTGSASLFITQSPSPNKIVGPGVTPVTFTVDDLNGNVTQCTSTFTVVPRVEIDPEVSFVVVSGACKAPAPVSHSITIENSGGHFNGGMLMWTASTTAGEITLVTSSGYEGDDLIFTVDPRYLPSGTVTRTITLTAKNSATNVPAINSPFTMTISIQIEPSGAVSLTKTVGTNWTVFTNSYGQKIAEVKSNAGTISNFTVNMYPCTVPQGLARIRYIRRYFTMSSSSPNPNVDIRLFYTNTESQGLITRPSALTVWQKPLNVWMNLGGTSNVYENFVQHDGLTSLAGPFAMAHNWFPKNGIEEEVAVPASITLSQNYPNPFNPSTVIRYSLPEAAPVRLVVHDFYGREIAVLAEGMRNAGTHEVVFDAANLPSGSYIYTLESNSVRVHRTMVLMK